MNRASVLSIGGLLLAALALSACQSTSLTPALDALSIRGIVLDESQRPLPGATVRIKATDLETVTDPDGRFVLTGLSPGEPVFVTAWAPGFFIGGLADVQPGAADLEIVLHAHHDTDNVDYAWLPSIGGSTGAQSGEAQACAQCHSAAGSPLPSGEGQVATLPVDEWLLDAHSGSAVNPRFLSMYAGTDLAGNQSPPTRYGVSRDYGRFPLRPAPDLPYYGPGYKLDFPDTAGNCAACHLPAAAIDDPYAVDPRQAAGAAAEGVPCDLCHKVWGVRLDADTGMPASNTPGVLSFEFRRPPEGRQFFAGPLDDVAPGEDTFSPIQRQSQFCAPCHFGDFWGITIYNSFGEWLASPYSDETSGMTCQDCHMPPLGNSYFALPEAGGVQRDPQLIFSHRMPGAADETLLRNAVSLSVEARRRGEQVVVELTITNDRTGHHVPTDSPLRQMLLLVQAEGPEGEALIFLEGPILPEWAGVGDPEAGYYAGLPGKGFAKILMELWTEVSPSGAYWNPTRIVSDTRIPAFGSDSSRFVFAAPAEGPARIDVRLLFRRAFKKLMDQKGWDVPDILMEEQTIVLP